MSPVNRTSKLSHLLSFIVAGILVLVPFHAIFTTWAGSNFGHLDLFRIWKELILILIIPPVIWLILVTPKLKQWIIESWVVRLFGLYTLLHLILGVWSLSHNKVNLTALIYGTGINLRFLTFFIVCLVVASLNPLLLKYWRHIILAPAGVVVLFGLLQKFILPIDFLKQLGYGAQTIPAFQTVDEDINLRRIQSTLRGANPLAAYLLLIITTLTVILRKYRIVQIMAIIFILIVLFFTYSRSAWLGLTISLIVLGGLSVSWLKNVRLILISGCFLLSLLAAGFYIAKDNAQLEGTIFHDSPATTTNQSSNTARANAIKKATNDIFSNPAGEGPGTAGPASFRNEGQTPRIAENYYLQIAQEIGIIGMAVFIAIIVIVGRQLYLKRHQELALVLFVSLVGLSFINLFLHTWTDDTIAYLWWGLAGIALAPFSTLKSK